MIVFLSTQIDRILRGQIQVCRYTESLKFIGIYLRRYILVLVILCKLISTKSQQYQIETRFTYKL
jgi:hypothetical protein